MSLSQRISEKLNDQTWYLELKSKWDDVDPKVQTQIKQVGLILLAALLIYLVVMSSLSASKTRKQIDEKSTLVEVVNNAQTEIKKLREMNSGLSENQSQPWPDYFKEIANELGLNSDELVIGAEKKPTPSTSKNKALDSVSEFLYELTFKKLNVKQLVKFIHKIENGNRVVKIRDLHILTQPDESGYLDLTISVSTFTMASAEGSL